MLTKIQLLIKPELDQLNENLKNELKTNVTLLNIIVNHVLKAKGKQIRPTLVILCARIFGVANSSTITAATMIELLHTATLVHDDVVDEAETRRGIASVFSKWKSKTAVLVGDFMLSKGLLIALRNEEIELLNMMSDSVQEMSEGELLQLEKVKRLNITEANYYEIISKKTATLIQTSCMAGCFSVSKDKELTNLAGKMGHHIGMAFQIKDDLLDLGKDDIGKPLTNDIRENKMTLPLIYTLDHVSLWERIKIKGNLRLRSQNSKGIDYIMNAIYSSGGIAYSEEKMKFHSDEAKKILANFPKNEFSEALFSLIEFTIQRKS